ncbi:MAG TPA: hypothetical protein VGK00_10070 [Anaerolineales bacterium]
MNHTLGHRNKLHLWVVSMGMLLAFSACVPWPSLIATPSPVAGITPAPYDGQWSGTGTTPEGRTIHLVFTIQESRLNAFTYNFIGQDGVPCTNVVYNQVAPSTGPQLQDFKLVATPGPDLGLQATFNPDGSTAEGTLAVNWQGRHNCTTQFDVHWTANRTQSTQTTPEPVKPYQALCGKANCLAILIQLLVFGLTNGAVLALNAISVTVVYGAVRTLNLAHGDVFSLSSALVTSIIIGLNVKTSWPPAYLFGILILSLAASVGFGMLLNIGLEWVAFRPFRGHSRLAPLIATLGISFILFQMAMVWRTHQASWIPGEHRSVPGLPEVPTDGIPNLLPTWNLVQVLGLPVNVTFRFNDLFILMLAGACALGTYVFLRTTRTGRAIQASMQNPMLARMIGIDLDTTIRRAFAIGGLLAGVAAFVFAIYYGRPFGQNGAQSGLFAFTAALLGGIGNPLGALTSAMILGVFSSFSDYLISAEWTPVLLLVLLIGLLFWWHGGLFDEDLPEYQSTATLRDSLTPVQISSGRKNLVLLLILASLAVFPLVSDFFGLGGQVLVRGIGIYILLALGLNILLGMAGVLDLGYAAAFGIGAYGAAIITNPWGQVSASLQHRVDFLLIFFFCASLGGLFGLLKSLLTTRLHSDYLALATLALGLLIPRLVINLKFLTGGAAGISALPSPQVFGYSFSSPTARYYLVFVVVATVVFASLRLIVSRTGRAWSASSEDETAASSSGVNVGRFRLLALVLSSALAGAAGALYASTIAYVDPDILSFQWTALLLTMVILGGTGNVTGVLLGAILIIGYDKIFIPRFTIFLSAIWPKDFFFGPVPDLQGTSSFNFGLILYLTVLLRAHKNKRQ